MFKVIGEIIEYNGQPFAYIIGSPITKGGWVIDARAEIEGAADLIDAAEITEFRTAFRSEINDILMERLTHAVEKLWLPEPFEDVLRDLIGPALLKALDQEISRTLRLTFKGEE